MIPHKIEDITSEAYEKVEESEWEQTMRNMESRAKSKTREKEMSEWDSVRWKICHFQSLTVSVDD